MITIRTATVRDVPQFLRLIDGTGYEWMRNLDWSRMETWMVAEHEGKIEGFVQIFMGKPTAHLEHLVLNERLSHTQQAKIVKMLLLTAISSLRALGAEMVLGTVPFELEGYKGVLIKRGGFPVIAGDMIALDLKWVENQQPS